MNLSHTFLGEIFVIFHRKYLPFFVICKKIFVKKICLERKAQNGIFTLSPSNKKSFVVGKSLCTVALAKDLVTVKYINSIGMCKLYHIQCKLSRKNSALGGIPKNSFKCGEHIKIVLVNILCMIYCDR